LADARKTQLWLRVVGAILALISLASLLSHVFNLLSMAFFLTFFGVPSILLLILLAAYAKKIDQGIFLRCLWIGLVGGFVGTCAYDLIRWGLNLSQLFDYNGFKAIHIFGSWISGKPVGTTEAAVAGWIYHFWNGLSFGVFYTLAFGRRHWLFGVGYGLFMEACMLGLFPIFLKVTDRFDFIMLSLIGHLFYGLGLGLIAQRYGRNWSDASEKP
jgi:hypothetical protein